MFPMLGNIQISSYVILHHLIDVIAPQSVTFQENISYILEPYLHHIINVFISNIKYTKKIV